MDENWSSPIFNGRYNCPSCKTAREDYAIVDVVFSGDYSTYYTRVVKVENASPGDRHPMLRACLTCSVATAVFD